MGDMAIHAFRSGLSYTSLPSITLSIRTLTLPFPGGKGEKTAIASLSLRERAGVRTGAGSDAMTEDEIKM
jgi:hypothetical protein